MAWAEWSGTRQMQMTGSGPGVHSVDISIAFLGVTGTENLAANMPVPGDTFVDVTGSGTIGTSFGDIVLAREPKVVWVSQVTKMTQQRCRVVCTFRGLIVE
jgi:hypothetical protein